MLHVDVRMCEDVVIVDFSGKLVAGMGDQLLREVVNELLAEDWKKILLNLSEVPYVDSSGIGELVASHRLAEKFGARLKLLQTGEDGGVRHMLHLSHLLPLFEVYKDEEEALRHF